MKRKILLGIIIAAAMTTGLLFAHVTVAQTTDQITVDDLGLSYGAETGLSNTDIRLTIARIIRVALGLLGIVALVLILYGGFVWMTAGGDDEKIQKAKKILINAAIGLIIILSAYAIASFVINSLTKATGYTGGGGEGGGGTGGFASTLYVTSMPGNDFGCGLRNLHPVIVFSRPVDLATVENNLVVRVKDGASLANGAWHFVSPTRQDSIVFDPVGDCGIEGQTDCLAASTTYQISFLHAENIKSQTGSLSLKCVGEHKNSCLNNPAVEFITGVGVDTEPPTVTITSPNDGELLAQGSSVSVEIEYTDNYGLQNLSLFADDNRIKTIPISGCKKSGSATINWPTGSTAIGVHAITAVATDNASLTASTTRNIKIIPAHCFDDVLDSGEDEIGPPACGANSECGHCGGDSCAENSDCASGFCDGGVCVDRMKIEGFSPTSGAASSTYVTIWGKYFGNDGGHIYFTSDDGDWTEAFVVNCGAGVDNWTSSQLVVKVPKNAATGPIRVETASTTGSDGVERQFSDTTDEDGWGVNQKFTVNSERLPGLCALVPNYGAPYSDTVLLGENFGSDSDMVLFGSSTSYIKSWANKSITARVPALGKGNATVQASVDGNLSNALRYNVRESLDDNTPIIESITPDHGAKGEYITITGKNFGNYQGTVWFKLNGAGAAKIGDTNFPAECANATWSDSRIIIKFPTDGVTVGNKYSVQILRALDSAVSPLSGINFDLESGDPAPGICAINPVSGPVPLANSSTMQIYGEYYTRNGESTPYFWQTSASATTTEGRTPAAGVVNESDTAAELYPSNYAETGPVVMHRSADDKIGNDLPFTVYNCLENNNKCSTDGYKCCTKGADAGVCKLEADLCAGETRSIGYIWRFNTGPFPPTAQVVEQCNAATDHGDNLPSPSPSIQWTSGGNTDQYNVCRSALVNVIFSMKMKGETINTNTIKIYPCNSIPSTSTLGANVNTCEHDIYTVSLQPSSYNLFTASGDETGSSEYISIAPVGDNWEDETYYQVVLSDDIMSATTSYYYGDEIRYLEEQNLKATRSCGNGTAYCFIFRTGNDDCQLSKVIISPYKYWTAILEAPMKYRALKDNADDAGSALYYKGNGLSDQHCIMMNMNNFEWRWYSEDVAYVDIYGTSTGIRGSQAEVSALANTVAVGLTDPDDAVNIAARASSTVDTTVKTGKSPLTIDLSNPKVTDYWPKCLEACTNAEVAAKFNILMSQHNLRDGSVKLDICRDENCTVLENVAINPRLNESDSRTIIIPLSSGAELATNTIYQVTVSKTGSSTADQAGQLWSGASSTNSNLYSRPMQTQFVWRFKTKSEKCVVDNVQIMPALYSAVYLHDKKVYSAEARSAPDTCDPKGQKLNTWNINWQWESSSTSVATVQSFSTHGQNPACTSNCLKKGSDIAYGEAVEPLCGNGRLEAGEDCDPPAKNGDTVSCTLNCLRPGNTLINTRIGNRNTTSTTSTIDIGLCGDGFVTPSLGEECDSNAPGAGAADCSEINCLLVNRDLGLCGDGHVSSTLGEECEPNISASNGCGANCLFIGSSASTGAEDVGASICGNGSVGQGEDCDLGIASNYLNPFTSLNCSANCLHVGTSLSSNWCANNTSTFGGFTQSEYSTACAKAKSQCGDGVVSPGEDRDCETRISSNPAVTDGCTDNCLPNSLILPNCTPTSSDYSDGYLVEQKTEGCSEIGQYEGSSLSYSTSSVCGDEVVGIGEDPDCESGFIITHTLTDPWVLATGVGLGSPIGEPPAQITDIKGTGQQTIGANTYTDSGTAQFRIKCGYTKDSECKAIDPAYGLADNSCCYEMASLISTYPKKSTSPVYDICPNTYIEAKFNRLIDQNTLARGVFVARGYESGHVCSDNEINVTPLLNLALSDSSNGGVLNWFANVWHRVIGWVKNIFGNTASAARTDYEAEVFCAINNFGNATVVSDMAMGKHTTSTVMINLNTALATNTDYAIILSQDVRDALGISIGSDVNWRFITADEICTLNDVTVNPPEYMYNTAGESVNFFVSSTAANGQMIQPVFGYAWEYEWGPAVNDIATLTDTTSSINLVTAKNRNGEIVLTATANITQNIIGVPSVSLSGQSDITVFLCENPWPSSSASDFPFYDEDYDFSTYYCRDYGSPGFADDLPYVTTTYFDASIASSKYAKRYIFTNTDNKDAIGMQIFYNPDHLSISDWYASEGFSGGVGSLKVDGYEALGSNYNYYIDALKTQTDTDNHIYPNIYQYSINNDATGETSEVFKQMMNNLKFNKNVRNEVFCADDLDGSDINYSMPCSTDMDCLSLAEAANKSNSSENNNNYICMNLRDKLQRDYVRLKDLKKILGNLTYGQGLIGAWSMDAINSYGRVVDASGHSMDGIVMGDGISITTGTIGNAMHLVQPNGSSATRSYLKLAQATSIGDRSFTVGQWVKTTSVTQQPAFISNTNGSGLNGFRFGMDSGYLWVSIGNSSGGFAYGKCSGSKINDGVWHHIVAVYERENANSSGKYYVGCYVDGVLNTDNIIELSSAYPGVTENATTNVVRIGTPSFFPSGYGSQFTADYDDVRIYGRALSEDEISAWYAGNLPITSVSYPKMADNTYLTGQALSVWPSAWSSLGSAIGITLPIDPINKLAQSGTCYLQNSSGGYDACYKDSDCAAISTAGRMSYWTADDTLVYKEDGSSYNSNTVDSGTLGNSGSMVGAVGTDTGKGHGKAFSFSGDSAAYVSFPNATKMEYTSLDEDGTSVSVYNSDQFTVSVWIYPTKKNTATIIKKGGTDSNGASQGGFSLEYSGLQFDGSQVHFNNGTIRFAVFPASSSAYSYFAIDSANPITVNAWHHVVASFNRTTGTGTLYIDGVSAGNTFRTLPSGAAVSVDEVQTAVFSNLNFEIGSSFNGLIDNVAFYTRAVTQNEVTNLRKGLCILHDAATGWSAEDRRFSFACNTSSYAYRYSYVSSTDSFLLRAKLEPFSAVEPINWDSFKKAYVGNWVNFNSGVCAADDEISSPYNVSCGDGVLGGTEECDPPGKKTYNTSACPSGVVNVNVCTNQCKWAVTSTVSCRSVAGGSCGDGKVQSQAGETCDDGALNGTRGRCNATCNGIYESCGDGVLEATEFCDTVSATGQCTFRDGAYYEVDPTAEPIYYFIIDLTKTMTDNSLSGGMTRLGKVTSSLPYIAAQFNHGSTRAKIGIGTFSRPPLPAKYITTVNTNHDKDWLDDSIGYFTATEVNTAVNNSEFRPQHGGQNTDDTFRWFRDEVMPSWSASDRKHPINIIYVTDGDGAVWCGTSTVTGSYVPNTNGTVCGAVYPDQKIADLYNDYGVITNVIGVGDFGNSSESGVTKAQIYQRLANDGHGQYFQLDSSDDSMVNMMLSIYKKPCSEYSRWSGYSCAWDCNGFGGYCGDGAVNGSETCEVDQSCTTGGKTGINKCVDCQLQGCEETTATVSGPCGDGKVDEEEACDLSDENGIVCTVEYPRKSCTYCSSDCKNVVTVDATCGNGLLDAGEVCDPEGAVAGHARTRYPWDAINGIWLTLAGDYCYSCNQTCTGWTYTEVNSSGSVCAPYLGYCGDGIVKKVMPLSSGWEECDGSDVSNCDSCGAGKVNICSTNCLCNCIPTVVGSLL